MYDNKKEDRAVGSIVGAAAGDAMGAPTEYISRDDLQKFYGGKVDKFENPCPKSPCKHLKAGQYTDDTQQLIALAESLVTRRHFDMQDFGKRMGNWAKKNHEDADFCRFPGGTSMGAGSRLYNGCDPRKSGKETAQTCGSSMRVAPIGVMWNNDLENLVKAAKLSSIPTHNSEVTKDSCTVVAATIAYLINGYEKEKAVTKALSHIQHDVLKHKIRLAISIKDKDIDSAIEDIGTYENAIETVPFAFYAFLKGKDFRDVISIGSSACPGDTDSIACIAGSMAGALYGYSAIPEDLKGDNLEDHDYLVQLGEQLYNPDAFRIDLHVHTFFGKDCSMIPPQAIEAAKKVGLDGIAFTEHMVFDEGKPAEEAGRELNFPVFRGAEYHSDKGHVLLFGIESDEVFKKFGKYGPLQEVINYVVENGGVAIPSHPYKVGYTHKLCDDVFDLENISGLEVLNGQLSEKDNKKAKKAAQKMKLSGSGGSDAHFPSAVGRFFTEFTVPIKTIEDLVEAIKKGQFRARDGRVLLSS
jgi:ADP-ribosylglycohydrolase/predicted metal-dependent phosphoesterase TrpH